MNNRLARALLIPLLLLPVVLARIAIAQPAPSSAGPVPAVAPSSAPGLPNPAGTASQGQPYPPPIPAVGASPSSTPAVPPPTSLSGSVPPAGAVSSSGPAPGQPILTGPPPAAQPAPPSPQSPPRQLAGRVGFGIGLSATPFASPVAEALPAPDVSGGMLGAGIGGLLGIRAWVRERIVLLPSLQMSISRTSAPLTTDVFGGTIEAANFTSGLFASSLSVGFAAYRGHSTRFVLSGGLRFGYSAQVKLVRTGTVARYEPVRTVSFAVPAGFALEQLFTPRISIVLGAESPLLSYHSAKIGTEDPTTIMGADFASTRLHASVFFYTD